MSNLDLDFDLKPVRAKYAEERDKRLREDKAGQYTQIRGEFAYFEDDPYTDETIAREPLTDLK